MPQIYYIPHGGGPMPLLGDPGYASLAAMLNGLNSQVAGCKAVIVVTAHWECDGIGLTTAAQPGMLYDYYGFPEESYKITYPAPGAPELAEKVAASLGEQGIASEMDSDRGYDHGTFVPMILIRPAADIPVLQMSLLASLDAAAHIDVGRALAPVLQDDVALIGSGFSFHNLPALTGQMGGTGQSVARAFHDWLDETICSATITVDERAQRLTAWEDAPGARFCHPREEHLLPLHVCAGAAEALNLTAHSIFAEPVKGYQTSGYAWAV